MVYIGFMSSKTQKHDTNQKHPFKNDKNTNHSKISIIVKLLATTSSMYVLFLLEY